MINDKDISFVLKKTKLELKKLITLIEEERDFHLLIDSISRMLTDSDRINYNKLSDVFRTRLGLYKFCTEDYDIEEKIFISNIMAYNYDYYYKNKGGLKKQNKELKNFIKFLKNSNEKTTENVKIPNEFNEFSNKSVIKHIKSWVNIINSSKSYILGENENKQTSVK